MASCLGKHFNNMEEKVIKENLAKYRKDGITEKGVEEAFQGA